MISSIDMYLRLVIQPRAVTLSDGAPVQTSIMGPPFFSVLNIQLSYFSRYRNH